MLSGIWCSASDVTAANLFDVALAALQPAELAILGWLDLVGQPLKQ